MIELLYNYGTISNYRSRNTWQRRDVNELKPDKEETMKNKLEQITLDIPNGYEFFGIDDNNKIVLTKKQPQYPKTYEECCKVIDINYTEGVDYVIGYKREIIQAFQLLLICRDAYWKITGDWKPDWNDDVEKYSIEYNEGELRPGEATTYLSRILSFPIREMRDAFYENFKELIEKVKELL